MKRIRAFVFTPIAAALMLVGHSAHAVPQLQLDILGGTYDSGTQTIMAGGNSFSLFAYYTGGTTAPTANYYVSMALQPSSPSGGSFGSFSFSTGSVSKTVSATGGMVYGNPPLETIAGLQGHDAGDLSPHGIYPAYFYEQGFKFSQAQTSGVYNTQTSSGIGPQAGAGMFYARFDFDISGLQQGMGLHFDLYDEVVKSCGKSKNCVAGDIDVNKFAPFSHDAGADVVPVTVIPEPETYAMLLAGLGMLGFAARRRKQVKRPAA